MVKSVPVLRSRQHLLASCSLAALFVGASAPAAFAASCTIAVSATVVAKVSNANSINCIDIEDSAVTGNVTNTSTGRLTSPATGIAINNSTILGAVSNAGVISTGAGIGINGSTLLGGIGNSGTISAANHYGIFLVFAPIFSGGISNSGTITSNGIGIETFQIDSFLGGISNSGKITAPSGGIALVQLNTFFGDIRNTGTISAAGTFRGPAAGILVSSIAQFGSSSSGGSINNSGTISARDFGIDVTLVFDSFVGDITNSGTISTATTGVGIEVNDVNTFTGGINNSGTLKTGSFGAGIVVSSVAQFGSTSAGGGIKNSGTISAGLTGIIVEGVSTFLGNISNSGTIKTGKLGTGIVVTGSTQFGSSSAGGGITNSGTITARTGINLQNIDTFLGGITNSGTITANKFGGAGIVVAATSFYGNVSNSGTITGGQTGIYICHCASFAGGAIINTGTIAGSVYAIDSIGALSPVTIDQMAGLISGEIALSDAADTLNISGGTIKGNILGQGNDVINFNIPSGQIFTYGAAYDFTSINAALVNSGTVILDGTSNSATEIGVADGAKLEVGDAAHPSAAVTSTDPLLVLGTLAGHGAVNGDVEIGSTGILSPGGSVGTLTINGDLQFDTSTGTYTVEIEAPHSSKTQVNGTATLNGAQVVAMPAGLGTAQSQTYTILSATTALGAGNTFNSVVTISPADVTSSEHFTLGSGTASLAYDTNDVLLTMPGYVITLVTPANAPVNAQNVANTLNHYILNGGTLPPGFQNLGNLSGGALNNALVQLGGQAGGSFVNAGFMAGDTFLNMVLNPFISGRDGGSGSGFGANTASLGSPALAYGDDPIATQANRAFEALAPSEQINPQRLTFWGGSYGGLGTIDGSGSTGSATTNAQVYGFLVGLDDHIAPDTLIGFALGGGSTAWQLDQAMGSGQSGMAQASLYGSKRFGAAYVSGALAYSWDDVTTSRTVTLAGSDTLNGSFDASVVSSRIEGGYHLPAAIIPANFGVTPYAALQAQGAFLPAYAEYAAMGSSQFALSYAARDAATVRTEIGAWFDTDLPIASGALKFYSKLAYAHDFDNQGTSIAFFQQVPGGSFLINAAKPAEDNALVTTGLNYQLGAGWSLIGKFDGEFAPTTQVYAGTAMIRKVW